MALTCGETEALVRVILDIPPDTELMAYVVIGATVGTDKEDISLGVAHTPGMCHHNLVATLATAINDIVTDQHITKGGELWRITYRLW